jgi:hypothetical protein
VVAVLFKAGVQVPVIPLSDVVGKAVKVAPEQIEATGVNVGVISSVIVTDVVAVTPGQPPLAATVYVTVYIPAVLVPGVMEPFAAMVKPAGNAE